MKTGRKSYIGPILIIVAALLWAFDGVIRRNLYSLPPITIIFFEHLLGLIILSPFLFKYIFKVRFTKKEWILLLVISVLSGLLGTLWFTTALLKVHFISFSVVFLLQKLQPIFAITSASIFLKEKLDKRYIIWAVLALVSAYFVTFKNGIVNLETGEGTIIAAIYALGAAFAWGTSTTFSKMLLGTVRAEVSTFFRFLFTVLLALPLIFIFKLGSSITAPTLPQFGLFALIAVSTGMVALLIYYKGLSKTSVHVATILELTFPFIAIFIDRILYKTVLSPSQWIAAFLLVFAIYKIAKLRENIEGKVI
ncbi:MAG: DMT family transporter [Candidatus Pacebacteria bacterium]|nr:DMT family transporter [Candidatus Paceibacterota bacterium]